MTCETAMRSTVKENFKGNAHWNPNNLSSTSVPVNRENFIVHEMLTFHTYFTKN